MTSFLVTTSADAGSPVKKLISATKAPLDNFAISLSFTFTVALPDKINNNEIFYIFNIFIHNLIKEVNIYIMINSTGNTENTLFFNLQICFFCRR